MLEGKEGPVHILVLSVLEEIVDRDVERPSARRPHNIPLRLRASLSAHLLNEPRLLLQLLYRHSTPVKSTSRLQNAASNQARYQQVRS